MCTGARAARPGAGSNDLTTFVKCGQSPAFRDFNALTKPNIYVFFTDQFFAGGGRPVTTRDPVALSADDITRIVQMAWEDRTPFDAIARQFGVNEQGVIKLMRRHLKRSSFELWRARVAGRKTKHDARRSDQVSRFKSQDQKGW